MKNKLLLLAISTVLCAQTLMAQVPSYVPTNGLVGYWPFNGNANDESGNGNNGTVNGATLTTDRFGNVNNAYSFDGSDIITANSIVFSNLTISIWYNIYDSSILNPTIGHPPTGSQLIGQGTQHSPTAYCDYSIGITNWNNINQFAFEKSITTGDLYKMFYSNASISYSNWVNLIYSIDSNNVKVYLNSVLIDTFDTTTNFIQSGNILSFGGRYVQNATNPICNNFTGKIDDISIWNRALSQQEITNLYASVSSNECLTMVINTGALSTNPVTYTSTVNIYPNPANDQITIDCGNLANVAGWNIKITNMLGQEVFNKPMNTQQYVVPLNTWSGKGMYFVKISNAQNEVVNIKKIILQ